MNIRRSWSEAAQNAGGGTFDLIDDLAGGIRGFACGLWSRFPDRMTNSSNLTLSFQRGFMNRACSDQPQPPPPEGGVPGGQCCDKTYNVDVAYRVVRCAGEAVLADVPSQIVSVEGRIENIYFGPIPGSPGLTGPYIISYRCNESQVITVINSRTRAYAPDGCDSGVIGNPEAEFINGALSFARINSIVTADGTPDDCGNLPPAYPPSPEPTDIDINTTFNITQQDGTDLTVPINLVVFDNDISASLSLPITVDVGGITATVDLGGIEFSANFGNNTFNIGNLNLPNGDRHPLPLPSPRPAPPEIPPPPNDIDYDEEEKLEEDPKQEEEIDKLEYVKVTITSSPSNRKEQFGDGAPNVIYAGWFEFSTTTFNFPRQPIHFQKCIFKAPEGATGYAYTLYEGFAGRATVYTGKTL